MIDPSDIGGITEIAAMFHVKPNVVTNWVKRYSSFPAPIRTLSCGSLWSLSDVALWKECRNAIMYEDAAIEIAATIKRDWDVT